VAIPYLKQGTRGGDSGLASAAAVTQQSGALLGIDGPVKRNPRVSIFRDFAEDRRTSMDVYADGLTAALRDFAGSRFEVYEQLPRPVKFVPGATGILKMRVSRYLYYPWFARSRRGDVNHIIDHGYAYLLRTLDPDRTVVTVHDLIPLLSWKGCLQGPIKYPHRPVLFERALRYLKRAGRILAVSENTKTDLIDHCGCRPERIRVIYSGFAPWCRMYDAEERRSVRLKLGIPDSETRLILITGSGFQWYKNHPTCLKVLARLVASCPWPVKMIRSGERTVEWQQLLADSGMERHFIQIPRLEQHSAMADIYNSADCLLFPSWYEGFGWPALEAMVCGIPVVTSDAASLPEIVGDAGLMCAPDDVDGLTQAVWSLLRRDGLNEHFTEAGLRRAARFTWRACAEQICQVYDSLPGGVSCS
jgi:glycosyltransferase involved in cell wall biosynthesis